MCGFFEGIKIKRNVFATIVLAVSINWFISLSFIFFGWENYVYEFFSADDILLISGIFGGFLFGCIIWGIIISRTNYSLHFMLFNIPQGILVIIFSFLNLEGIILYGYLIVLGMLPGAGIVGGLVYFTKSTRMEERGRISGVIVMLGLLFMCALAVLSIFIGQSMIYILIGGILYLSVGLIFLFIIKTRKVETLEPEHFAEYNRKDFFSYLIPIILLGMIGGIGLFFALLDTSVYHPLTEVLSNMFFGKQISLTLMELEVMLFTVLGAPMSLFVGYISDFYGRRRIWYFGLVMGVAGAFLFGFFQTWLSLMLDFVFFGIVFCCIANYILITYSDLLFSEKNMGRYLGLVVGIGVGGGLLIGAGIGYFLIDIPVSNFALTLMLLVLFGFGALGQAQETLPPRSELEWYRTLKHLYIIHENGICMYDCPFQASETDSQLVSGGISGIMAIIQELTESKTRLKIIRQEDMNILLEYIIENIFPGYQPHQTWLCSDTEHVQNILPSGPPYHFRG